VWQVPKTRPSILIRVQDPSDQEAWAIFESIYRPAIYRAARATGLQDADASDIAQVVLTNLSQRTWQFSPDDDRARFRTWLSQVTRNAVTDFYRTQRQDVSFCDADHLVLDESEIESQLEHEYRHQVFRWAANIIKPEFSDDAWQSFWRSTVEGVAVDMVAAKLNRSVGSVYTSRSRIMRRLREQVGKFDERLDQEL